VILANVKSDAAEKIKAECMSATNLSPKEKAVMNAVRDTLLNFCQQSAEFASAVVNTGKCMEECLKEIMKGVGNSISDFEVYRRAVAFWMDGADVHAELRIVLPESDGEAEENEEGKRELPDARENGRRARRERILSLEDLL
jgi:hypothetical protein